jgi:LacI family transcriptional regulator, galactose operon repressor
MATMKDVARAAGVSIYTVSATLSGAAYVSPELRARVNKAIEKLDYQRNSMASGLKRGTSSLIGLIVSDVTNPFFTELVDCIQNKARLAGYSVLLGISGHEVECERELLRLMGSHQAAGTVLCPAGNESDYQDGQLATRRMKVVAIDNAPAEMGIDTVALDNRRAAAAAVEHLLALGHRRIAMVAGIVHQYVSQQRLYGYQETLERQGIEVRTEFVRHGNFRVEDAYHSCKRLINLPQRPTALFVANNLMLIGVMRALSEAGVKVPRDMSVASIDDFPWASAFEPALTVVRQPVADMASTAFGLLMKRLEGGEREPSHRVFTPELVVRESSAVNQQGV